MEKRMNTCLKKGIGLMLLLVGAMFTPKAATADNTTARTSSKIIVEKNYLWIATNYGLVKFNKQTEQSVVYNQTKGDLPDNKIECIIKDHQDNIWLTTLGKGIGKFDGINCQIYDRFITQFNAVNNMAIDKDNNKWVGYRYYIYKYDDINWVGFYYGRDPMQSYTFTFKSLKFDKSEELWFVGRRNISGFLAKVDGDNVAYVEDFMYETLSLEIDDDNNKWLGSKGEGLIKYDGTDFTYYTTDNSQLPGNIVYDIKKDGKGNLWLLSGGCLVKFDGTAFVNYPIPYTDELNCLELDGENTVWMTSGTNILVKYTNGEFRRIDLNDPLDIDIVPLANEGFSIYPNPASSEIHFRIEEGTQPERIEAYDASGRLTGTLTLSGQNSILLPQLNIYQSGLYLIKVTTGDKTYTSSLLVK